MNRLLALVCLAALNASPLVASEAALKQSLAKWDAQLEEWRAAVDQASTPEEKQRAMAQKPDGRELAVELWKAVGYRSMRRPWACPAVVWWLNHPHALAKVVPPAEMGKAFERFWKAIDAVHYQDPRIAGACAALSRSSDVRVYRMLEKIYAANPDDKARGAAAMALALYLNRTNSFSEAEWGGKDMMRAKRLFYVREALLKAPGVPFGDSTVEKVAAEEVYRLRNLSEGCIPPIVSVVDKTGKAVSIPARVKPTILFFCTPGDEESTSVLERAEVFRAQYPEFAFCPVVSSLSQRKAASLLAEQGVSCDFYTDPQGGAAHAYRVQEWPRVALISHRCRLLFYGAPNLDFQTRLDAYKAELDGDAAQKKSPRVSGRAHPSAEAAPVSRAQLSVAPNAKPAPTPPAGRGGQDVPPALRPMPNF